MWPVLIAVFRKTKKARKTYNCVPLIIKILHKYSKSKAYGCFTCTCQRCRKSWNKRKEFYDLL